MVFRCSIPGCNNTSKTSIVHSLPRDPEVRKKWSAALNRPDIIDIKDKRRYNVRVCDVHFAEDAKFPAYKNRTNLKYYAVPTLHLSDNPVSDCATLKESPSLNVVSEVQPSMGADCSIANKSLVPSTSTGISASTRKARPVDFELRCFETPQKYRLLGYGPKNTTNLKSDAPPTIYIPKKIADGNSNGAVEDTNVRELDQSTRQEQEIRLLREKNVALEMENKNLLQKNIQLAREKSELLKKLEEFENDKKRRPKHSREKIYIRID